MTSISPLQIVHLLLEVQLDGDNLRNAFLNAPWVKAVIPIRPGREKAALKWLHTAIEGDDGWKTDYIGSTPEDQAIIAELVAEGKKPSIGNVLEKITDQMEKQNSDALIGFRGLMLQRCPRIVTHF